MTVPERPRRILVYGVTGSGKSSAADRIGARAGLPVVHVDDLTWEPGWVAVPLPEQRARIAAATAGEAWVVDGAYRAWIDLVHPRADLVVGLDYPRWLSLSRLVRRTASRWVRRTRVCNGNVETLDKIVSRDSILVWHARSFARKRDRMRAWSAAHRDDPTVPPTLLVTRPRDLEAWIASLPAG